MTATTSERPARIAATQATTAIGPNANPADPPNENTEYRRPREPPASTRTCPSSHRQTRARLIGNRDGNNGLMASADSGLLQRSGAGVLVGGAVERDGDGSGAVQISCVSAHSLALGCAAVKQR